MKRLSSASIDNDRALMAFIFSALLHALSIIVRSVHVKTIPNISFIIVALLYPSDVHTLAFQIDDGFEYYYMIFVFFSSE